jgi:polysaccharide deacetylase family protein (PEP-CTERM system associated)
VSASAKIVALEARNAQRFIPDSARLASANPVNAMSIDVEDYFQVSALESRIGRARWSEWELRVDRNTRRALEMFDEAGVKATFFTLGWVADKCPSLVREIVDQGHELASHGYEHKRATMQTQVEFREDIRRAKQMLEDLSGVEVRGYRAPSYSIGEQNLWAFDELAAAGYRYSSSVYPIAHDLYGMPDAPRFAFRLRESGLLEVPVTTLNYAGRNWPCGGGGFFRLLPYALFKRGLNRVNRSDRQPGLFYFHPWELDPDQPRVDGLSAKSRFRHYLNLSRMQPRLARLLRDFRWDRMDRVFLGSEPQS